MSAGFKFAFVATWFARLEVAWFARVTAFAGRTRFPRLEGTTFARLFAPLARRLKCGAILLPRGSRLDGSRAGCLPTDGGSLRTFRRKDIEFRLLRCLRSGGFHEWRSRRQRGLGRCYVGCSGGRAGGGT